MSTSSNSYLKGALLACALLSATPFRAEAVTINFDELNVSAGPQQFDDDHYLNLGVRLSLRNPNGAVGGPTIVQEPWGGNGASSDPNAVAFGFGGSLLEALFIDSVTGLAGVTDFVSFVVGDRSGEADPIFASAFDINGALLGTGNFTSQPTNVLGVQDFGTISFALAGIHRIVVGDRSSSGASFDDLTFNRVRGAEVPEPTTMALVLSGTLGRGMIRRKRAG